MGKFKFLCLFLVLMFGFQTIYAQEHKHAGLTGKEKTIVVKPTRSNFTYTLNVVVTNCEIDGNIFVYCADGDQIMATYHVVCEDGHWVWGCNEHCYYHGGGYDLFLSCGITQQDLLSLVSMIHDADTCCVNGSPNSCDTIRHDITNPSDYGLCNKIEIVCCGNRMKVTYKVFNCRNQNDIISINSFWANYNGQGPTNNVNSYSTVNAQGDLSESMRNRILEGIFQEAAGDSPCSNLNNNN